MRPSYFAPGADKIGLVLALIIRLGVAPFTGHPYDMSIWFETGRRVAELKSPYDLALPIGYTGIWPMWLGASFTLASILLAGNSYIYIFIIKLPIIAADFAIPNLLVHLLKQVRSIRLDPEASARISRYYLLNPFVILVGAIWGMPDSIVAAGVLVTLLTVARPKVSGALMALSVLVKPYPLVLLPPLLSYLQRKAWKVGFLLFAIVAGISAFPFILLGWDYVRVVTVLLNQTSRFPNAISPTAILVNLSLLYPQMISSQQILDVLVLPLPTRFLWLIALGILTALLLVFRGPSTLARLIAWMRIFAAAWYLLFLDVSEQTLLPFITLCIVDADISGSLRKRSTYWLLSAVVTAFIILNVPVWGFAYPVISIGVSGPIWDLFQGWGLIALRLVFVIVMLRDVRNSWKTAREIEP